MPSGPIANDDYIDDPNRTTEEVQDALNQLFDFVRDIKTELSTLSLTTFKEAAVRGVGSATGELPDTEELNARLGTSGNLGTSATKDMGPGGGLNADKLDDKEGSEYVAKTEFNPLAMTLVWGPGSATYVPLADVAGGGAGFYLVESNNSNYLVWIDGTFDYFTGTSRPTSSDRGIGVRFSAGSGFEVWAQEADPAGYSRQTISNIYKLA